MKNRTKQEENEIETAKEIPLSHVCALGRIGP